MAGRWTGWQNSLGNLARCQRAGSDRIRNRLHRTFFVAFVIMAFVALLAAVSYVFVIGPVKEIAWEG